MDADAIGKWAESKMPIEPAPRKPAGGGGRVAADERREIQLAHLVDGLNVSQLAVKFGRTRETISGLLKAPDFEALRQEVQADLAVMAKNRLAGGVGKAADCWVDSVEIAALKGDHKPAKDLLEAVGVIDRSDVRNQVMIHIGMPGHPVGPDPFDGLIDVTVVHPEGPK